MRSVHPNLDTSISSSVNDNGKRHNLDIQVSQDSVATCLRCDEDFVAMLLLSSTVKEVYKSAKDCQSRVAYFLTHGVLVNTTVIVIRRRHMTCRKVIIIRDIELLITLDITFDYCHLIDIVRDADNIVT